VAAVEAGRADRREQVRHGCQQRQRPVATVPRVEQGQQPDGDVKCPICDRPRTDLVEEDGYDEDFDYYWGNVRLPLWIALIWQVPWRQRLDIFVVGFIIGLIVAGIAVFWGLLLAQY